MHAFNIISLGFLVCCLGASALAVRIDSVVDKALEEELERAVDPTEVDEAELSLDGPGEDVLVPAGFFRRLRRAFRRIRWKVCLGRCRRRNISISRVRRR